MSLAAQITELEFLLEYNPTISVVGLGYVGLPVAVAMAKKFRVIGFDINSKRIAELKFGYDRTNEVRADDLESSQIRFTDASDDLEPANFHIIAVPTPVDRANRPDLNILKNASALVGTVLKTGDIVVFESTVYPGATEEECIPVLEKFSGLRSGIDFKVGYSPERINPGDHEHRFETIRKVVSGQDQDALEKIAHVYGSVVRAGVYRAPSIKVAEAAKVIENTQRDLNIALMNELSLIFDKLGIDTLEVLEAAGTKWNFLNFKPGLVGGHCIGVDPYYLTQKAEEVGHHCEVILSGRRINDGMGKFIAHKALKELARSGRISGQVRATILGFTFKENCPDIRNTKVIDIVEEFESFGVRVQVTDYIADREATKKEYGISLMDESALEPADIVIVAVAHDQYRGMDPSHLLKESGLVLDVKGILDRRELNARSINCVRV